MTAYGYGTIAAGQRKTGMLFAHRVSWALAFGPVPAGMEVCHRCDNRPCVNPDHLFLGTHAENMADCAHKRRHAHGERVPRAKLTDEDIPAIRVCASEGWSDAELAAQYDVAPGTIYQVVHYQTWRHVA